MKHIGKIIVIVMIVAMVLNKLKRVDSTWFDKNNADSIATNFTLIQYSCDNDGNTKKNRDLFVKFIRSGYQIQSTNDDVFNKVTQCIRKTMIKYSVQDISALILKGENSKEVKDFRDYINNQLIK
jgi:hypothetical protein